MICAHALGGLGFAGTAAEDPVIALGRGGVTLFFLLSGYLIFHSVEALPIKTFLLRRFFKVMPSYWLNILIILALDLAFAGFEHHSAASYVADVFVVADLLRTGDVSGVFWTLLIEIKFYVFIAIQYAVLGRRHLRLVMGLLLALAGAAWMWRGQGSLTLAYFPIFYLGVELALAEQAKWRGLAMLRLAVVTLILAGSLALCLERLKLWSAGYVLLSAVLFVSFRRWNFSNRALMSLGLVSYSVYLYHAMVMGALFEVANGGNRAVLFVLAIAAGVSAGAVMYRLVEVPMVRLGRRWE